MKNKIKLFIENQLKKGEDVLFNFNDCLDNDKDFNYNKDELEEYVKDLYAEEFKDFLGKKSIKELLKNSKSIDYPKKDKDGNLILRINF